MAAWAYEERDGDFTDALAPQDLLDQVENELTGTQRSRLTYEQEARRRADRKIVEILAADGFEGPRFTKLAGRLMEYGWPIMMKWLSTGEIFVLAERFRRPVQRHVVARDWTYDDRVELASEIVLAGVEFFQEHALRRGKWDSAKGASLRTYFIGSCLCCFGTVYNRWWRGEVLRDSVVSYGLDLEGEIPDFVTADRCTPGRMPDPCDSAVIQDEVRCAVWPMTDLRLRRVIGLRAIGYTQADAAKDVGMTEKAAERKLSRYRKRLMGGSGTQPTDEPGDEKGR